jgi:hypothetical protein
MAPMTVNNTIYIILLLGASEQRPFYDVMALVLILNCWPSGWERGLSCPLSKYMKRYLLES